MLIGDNIMRLPDPYTSAAAPGFMSAKLLDVDPYLIDNMPNATVLKTKSAYQYWELELAYPDLTEYEYKILSTALANSKRLSEAIQVLLPQYEKYNVKGDTTTTTIADGQVGSTIEISSVGGLIGRPNVGDLFKLSSGHKVYKIVEVTVAANSWQLGIYPQLEKPTNNSKPIFNNILFNTELTNQTLPVEDVSLDGFYRGVSLSLREVLNG